MKPLTPVFALMAAEILLAAVAAEVPAVSTRLPLSRAVPLAAMAVSVTLAPPTAGGVRLPYRVGFEVDVTVPIAALALLVMVTVAPLALAV